MCIYIYICTCICMYMYIYIYIYIYMCIHINMHLPLRAPCGGARCAPWPAMTRFGSASEGPDLVIKYIISHILSHVYYEQTWLFNLWRRASRLRPAMTCFGSASKSNVPILFFANGCALPNTSGQRDVHVSISTQYIKIVNVMTISQEINLARILTINHNFK